MSKKSQLELYKAYVYPYYEGKDPSHNFQHIERILSHLELLSLELPIQPRLERLYFLACFHELSSLVENDSTFREQSREFLRTLGWRDAEIDELFTSLAQHIDNPQTLEEKIIHDANYIEILGALGIAKAFTTGGTKNQSLQESARVLESYVNKVTFQTLVGKRLAEEGRAYVQDFLKRLRMEW